MSPVQQARPLRRIPAPGPRPPRASAVGSLQCSSAVPLLSPTGGMSSQESMLTPLYYRRLVSFSNCM